MSRSEVKTSIVAATPGARPLTLVCRRAVSSMRRVVAVARSSSESDRSICVSAPPTVAERSITVALFAISGSRRDENVSSDWEND